MSNFISVTYDHSDKFYRRDDTGEEVHFTKNLRLRDGGDEWDAKLEFTREFMGERFAKPLPIVRLSVEVPGYPKQKLKMRLDGWQEDDSSMSGLEISEDCLVAVRAEAA